MDSQILFKYQKDEFLSKLIPAPQGPQQLERRLHVVDVDHCGNSVVPYPSKILESELGQWLDKEPEALSEDDRSVYKSRSMFILGPVLGNLDGSTDSKGLNYNPSIKLPFSKNTFIQILNKFRLPDSTPWLLVSNSTHFHRYRMSGSKDSDDALGFTMRLTTRGVLKIDISASVSYQPSTGAVNVFLQGCSSEQQDTFVFQLQRLCKLTRHPLLILLLLVEMKLREIEQEEQRLWDKLVDVETLSQQTGAPAIVSSVRWIISDHSESTNKKHSNVDTTLQSITIGVLQVIQLTTYAESHAKSLLLAIEEIQESIDALNSSPNDTQKIYIKETGAILSEKLDLLAHKTRVAMANIEFVEKRAQAQQSAVYNYIARLDARAQKDLAHFSGLIAQASKRDSSAMKAIAVLTMVFLPGTYIATFFAMPILDFTANTHLPSANHAFWLYWAVSIPLTAAVLMAYVCFQLYTGRKHHRQDQELQEAATISLDHLRKRG